MKDSKTILALGAHPDDIEYGCGGTLLRHKEFGNKVYLYVMTDGSRGGDASLRRHEQQAAADYLEADGLFWGGFKDTEISDDYGVIQSIERVVKSVRPDELYMNYRDDTHQDHRKLAQAGEVASRSIRKVFYYEDWSTRNFNPNVFVDVGNLLDRKQVLLGMHKSQAVRELDYNQNDLSDAVEAVARFWGLQAKIRYAEAFLPVRYVRDLG